MKEKVLLVALVILGASESTTITKCHFAEQVGCIEPLIPSELHRVPGNHDQGSCALNCHTLDHLSAIFHDGECFCTTSSDHRHLLVADSNETKCCRHKAFAISCNSNEAIPKLFHNLCPDYNRTYCNSSYSINERIEFLLSYMSQHDKIQTMAQKSVSGNYHDGTPLVARDYRWWNEALHGVEPHHDPPNDTCRLVCPTQFAEANALSQAWNRSLWKLTASAIATEVRAYYNQHVMEGLTLYAPQINLASNPLWGRNMETPGEDPFLTSMYALDFVNGLQGSHEILKTIATPKHFVGHFFEGEGSDPWGNGTQVLRYANDTIYSLQDLEQYYLPPFRAALRDAESVMCAYQSVNGVPMCANGFLLNRVLRDTWKWDGFVVSDCDAIDSMRLGYHGYSLTGEMAVQDGVKAGCDSNCGKIYFDFGRKALEMGLFSKEELDTSVRRLLRPLFRLGLFDSPDQDPYGHLGWEHVNTDKHKELSLEGSRQGIVLLQNGVNSNVLPLSTNSSQVILVAGPMYNATVDMLGNYNGPVCDGGGGECITSPSQWIDKLSNNSVRFMMRGVPDGCTEDESDIPWVIHQAQFADVIILGLGGTCHEREGIDRGFLQLPGSQLALFKNVCELGKPIVVFIIGGGTYSIDDLKGIEKVAVLQVGFPGPYGGRAIAEVIFGRVNPSGKLSTTMYPSTYATSSPMRGTPWMDSRIRPSGQGEGRSHMFYNGTPLFPFGFGLSYTTFSISWPHAHPTAIVIDLDHVETQLPKVAFHVKVTNTGSRSGKEVVQAYWSPSIEVDSQLKRQLFGFQSAVLDPGASVMLHFHLPVDANTIASVNEAGDRLFRSGMYLVTFTRGYGETLKVNVEIKGKGEKLISSFPSPWVDDQGVTVDACVEGISDIVRHTEPFLLAYKQWEWVTVLDDQGRIQHIASGMCLQHDATLHEVSLGKCIEEKWSQVWSFLDSRISPLEAGWLCLTTSSVDSSQLRTQVYLSTDCSSPYSGWSFRKSEGFLQSHVPINPDSPFSSEEGLCLAARSEGRYNFGA